MKFLINLILLSTIILQSKYVFSKEPHDEDRVLPLLLESPQVTEIIENTERLHNNKCKIKSATRVVNDFQMNYGCNGEINSKVLIRANLLKEKVKVLNYQVFIK